MVEINASAIEAAVKMSARYINDRFLPDKAIDVIDEAASKLRLTVLVQNEDVEIIERKLKKLEADKEEALIEGDYEKGVKIKKQQERLKSKLNKL